MIFQHIVTNNKIMQILAQVFSNMIFIVKLSENFYIYLKKKLHHTFYQSLMIYLLFVNN